MRRFLFKLLVFSLIYLTIIICSLLFVTNTKISDNSLYANIDKHKRLDSLPSPKIIFVGASNLCYGLNSETIEKKIGLPVVNMGLHAGFGLRFTINEVKHAVKKGDIVVFSPVYEHFTSYDMFYGEKILIALLFDVDRRNLKYIDFPQSINLLPNAISYSISKLFSKTFDTMQDDNIGYEKLYKRNSFNKYGDEDMHYSFEDMHIPNPKDTIQTNAIISDNAIIFIAKFKDFVEYSGATFMIVPPPLRYENSLVYRDLIDNIESELSRKNIHFIISPEKCNMADSLFFNTPYHLNKDGVGTYTQMISNKINKCTEEDEQTR